MIDPVFEKGYPSYKAVNAGRDLNIKIEQDKPPPKLTVIEGNKEDPKIVPLKPTDPSKP